MINKRWVKSAGVILFNIILVVFIIKWLWTHVDFNQTMEEVAFLDSTSVLLSTFLGIGLNVIYGLRLALLLDIKLLPSIQIVIMGFGFNAILPFRLGEVVKIFFAKQFFNVDLTKSTLATIIEKCLDLSVIVILGGIFIFNGVKVTTLLALGLLGASSVVIFHKLNNKMVKNIIQLGHRMLAKNKLSAIMICTLLIWFITLAIFYLYFKLNLGADNTFGILGAITLLVMTTLAISIPSMPASIGIFEAGIVYYLTQHFHFLAEKAVAYAIIFHLVMILPQILMTVLILLINFKKSENVVLYGGA